MCSYDGELFNLNFSVHVLFPSHRDSDHIFFEFKIKIHIRMQKRCIRIFGVRQAALSVAHEMLWRCKCCWVTQVNPLDEVLLHCSFKILHEKRTSVRRRSCLPQNWNQRNLFMQNTYFMHFLEGQLSLFHSRLAQDSRMFRKPCKINVSSSFRKKHV